MMSALEAQLTVTIVYGVSDGTTFIGFHTPDKGNCGDVAPCFGVEGVSGANLSSMRNNLYTPKPSDSFYPGQYDCLHSQVE